MKNYKEWVLNQRKNKHLHAIVEEKLKTFIKQIAPNYEAISEVQGLAGGRNDLTLFEYSGRKVLFEIFATKSQVSRDLRILDKTQADIKIAIIIDKEIDGGVFEKFIRENPEHNYPFLFIKELFIENLIESTYYKMHELIHKKDIYRARKIIIDKNSREEFERFFTKNDIDFLTIKDIKEKKVSIKKVLIYLVLKKIN